MTARPSPTTPASSASAAGQRPHRPTAQALRPHCVIATVADAEIRSVVAILRGLPATIDVAEVRLDYLWPGVPDGEAATDDILAIVDATAIPLLATLRPKRQGGRFDGPEPVRLGLLQAALQAGFTQADVELDVMATGGVARSLGAHGAIVASHHEFGEMPCRSDGLRFLQSMQDFAGPLDKLALTTSAFPDVLRALEFTRAHAERGGHPAVTTMGHGGAALRALLPFAGNRATYGAAPGTIKPVSGQPQLADIEAVWRDWGLGRDDLDHLAARPRPWLAVLGFPVAHSRSPTMHNAALRRARRDERFGALEVPASASALRLALHVAPRIGMVGVSVTAPHKQDAARAAKSDATATAIGAANCLRFSPEGTADATNTDATAMRRIASSRIDAGQPALVLGSGGAARAAVHALHALGAKVTVASRDATRGQATTGLGASWVTWEKRAQTSARLIVNATPLGAEPGDPSPVPSGLLAGRPSVVELVYASGPSSLQRDATAAGCDVVDGTTFLLEQGIDAYRFWFGADGSGPAPDRAAMAKAIETKLGAKA